MKKYVTDLKIVMLGIVVVIAGVCPSLAFASNYRIQPGGEIDMGYLVNAGDSFVIADDGDYFGRIDLSTGYVNVIVS